jgi:hypothetical protein
MQRETKKAKKTKEQKSWGFCSFVFFAFFVSISPFLSSESDHQPCPDSQVIICPAAKSREQIVSLNRAEGQSIRQFDIQSAAEGH